MVDGNLSGGHITCRWLGPQAEGGALGCKDVGFTGETSAIDHPKKDAVLFHGVVPGYVGGALPDSVVKRVVEEYFDIL